MSEAEKLKDKEIQDHAAWLKEHADILELPGGKSLAEVTREAVETERAACAELAQKYADKTSGASGIEGRLIATAIGARILARGR